MFMYTPDGEQAIVAPDQVEALLASGWTKEPLESKKEEVAKSTSQEDNTNTESDTPSAPKKGGMLLKKKA